VPPGLELEAVVSNFGDPTFPPNQAFVRNYSLYQVYPKLLSDMRFRELWAEIGNILKRLSNCSKIQFSRLSPAL